jgi:thiamine kinase-like enzyme
VNTYVSAGLNPLSAAGEERVVERSNDRVSQQSGKLARRWLATRSLTPTALRWSTLSAYAKRVKKFFIPLSHKLVTFLKCLIRLL